MLRRQCVCLIFSKNIRFIRPDGRRSQAPRIRSRNCRGHYDRAVAVLLALIGWLKPHSFLNAGAGRQDPHVKPLGASLLLTKSKQCLCRFYWSSVQSRKDWVFYKVHHPAQTRQTSMVSPCSLPAILQRPPRHSLTYTMPWLIAQ